MPTPAEYLAEWARRSVRLAASQRISDAELALPDGERALRARYALQLERGPERLNVIHRQRLGAPAPRQEWIDEVLLTMWSDRQELVRGQVREVSPTRARALVVVLDKFIGPRGIELLRAVERDAASTARNDVLSDRRYIAVLADPFAETTDEPEYRLPEPIRAQLLAMPEPPRAYDTIVFVREPARGFRRGEPAPYHAVARVRDPSLATVIFEPLAGSIFIDRRVPEPGTPAVLEPDDYARAGIYRESIVVENPFGAPRESRFRLVERPDKPREMTRGQLLALLSEGARRLSFPRGVDRDVVVAQLYTAIGIGRSSPSLRALRAKFPAARELFQLATGITLPPQDLGIEEVFKGEPLVTLSGDPPKAATPRRTIAVRVPPRFLSTLRRPQREMALFDMVRDQGLAQKPAAGGGLPALLFDDRQALVPEGVDRQDVTFGDVLALYDTFTATRGGGGTLHLVAIGLVVDESLGRVYFDAEPCDTALKVPAAAAAALSGGPDYVTLPPASAAAVRRLECFPATFEVPLPPR